MTLFAIFAFIAFTLGSFIWFIATWNPEAEEPVSMFHQDNNGGRV